MDDVVLEYAEADARATWELSETYRKKFIQVGSRLYVRGEWERYQRLKRIHREDKTYPLEEPTPVGGCK